MTECCEIGQEIRGFFRGEHGRRRSVEWATRSVLDRVEELEASEGLAASRVTRRRRCSPYVHETPEIKIQ